jgi:uncharacterized membrane protein YuzA (DUF378 family)
MVQTAIAYLIVALAAAWVIWRMFVPGKVRADVMARLRRKR